MFSSRLHIIVVGLTQHVKAEGLRIVQDSIAKAVSDQDVRKGIVVRTGYPTLDEIASAPPVVIGILHKGETRSRKNGSAAKPHAQTLYSGIDTEAVGFLRDALDNPSLAGRILMYGSVFSPGSENGSLGAELRAFDRQIRKEGDISHAPFRDGADLQRKITRDLGALLKQLRADESASALIERICKPHDDFHSAHAKLYREMRAHPARINTLLEHAPSGVPVVVQGLEYSGKSPLLAHWSDDYEREHPSTKVIRHFVQALGREPDHRAVLRHIAAALKRAFRFPEPLPPGAELERQLNIWFDRLNRRTVLIVIDGLDRLHHESRGLEWLSTLQRRNVRLVVSTRPGATFDALKRLGSEMIELETLHVDTDRRIIEHLMNVYHQEIDAPVLAAITNPALPLSRGNAEARFDLARAIAARSMTPDSSADVYDELLRLREDMVPKTGKTDAMRETLVRLWATRNGLRAEQLRAMARIGAEACEQTLAAFELQLRCANGYYTIIDDQMRRAIERRYLAEPEQKRNLHRHMAQHYECNGGENGALEEPWHWYHAGNLDALRACLLRQEVFERLYAEGRELEILWYWRQCGPLDAMAAAYLRTIRSWSKGYRRKPADDAECRTRLGMFLRSCGEFGSSATVLAGALKVLETASAPDRPSIAQAQARLAESLRMAGAFDRARALFRESLKTLSRHTRTLRAVYAQVLSDYALLLRDSHDREDPVRYFRRAIKLKEQCHTRRSAMVAESLNDLALVYHDRRQFTKAITLYRQALSIQRMIRHTNGTAFATYLQNLAGACHDTDRLDEAIRHYRRALRLRKRSLSDEHLHTILTRMNLGALLRTKGKPFSAMKMLRKALKQIESRHDRDHEYHIATSINLAQILREQGRIKEAELRLRDVLKRSLRNMPTLLEHAAKCTHNLAGLLRRSNRFPEAYDLYEQAVILWSKLHHPLHELVASAEYCRGECAHGMGDLKGAIKAYRKALAIRIEQFGHDDPLTNVARYRLGAVLDKYGDATEALEHLEAFLEIARPRRGDSATDVMIADATERVQRLRIHSKERTNGR